MIVKNDGPFIKINNILAGQTPKSINIFTEFILTENFDLIIEIGTGRAGFTEFLYSLNKNVISYDITPERNQSTNMNIDFRIGDSMNSEVIKSIGDVIKKYDKVLLLCDGGNKEGEIKEYCKLLKKGSYIMCHDYAHSIKQYRYYQGNTGWPSEMESFYDNISEYMENCGFTIEHYLYDKFLTVFWGCFLKNI